MGSVFLPILLNKNIVFIPKICNLLKNKEEKHIYNIQKFLEYSYNYVFFSCSFLIRSLSRYFRWDNLVELHSIEIYLWIFTSQKTSLCYLTIHLLLHKIFWIFILLKYAIKYVMIQITQNTSYITNCTTITNQNIMNIAFTEYDECLL